MKIKLLCFGVTKDMIGTFEKSMELPEGVTVKILKEKLEADYPDLKKLNSLRIAVNEEYADQKYILSEKDEVVLIPPVSGG